MFGVTSALMFHLLTSLSPFSFICIVFFLFIFFFWNLYIARKSIPSLASFKTSRVDTVQPTVRKWGLGRLDTDQPMHLLNLIWCFVQPERNAILCINYFKYSNTFELQVPRCTVTFSKLLLPVSCFYYFVFIFFT